MLRNKLGRYALLVGSPAIFMASSFASANQVVVSTFDTPSSFQTQAGFPTFDTYGLDNAGTPKTPNVRFDNGAPTPTATWVPSWSSQDAANNPSSGSLLSSWNWNEPADGQGAMDFTLDVNNAVQNYTNLSFDVMVDPTSAQDSSHGVGFFEVVIRNANYDFNKTAFNEELGNPTFAPAGDEGTWEHISIPLLTPLLHPLRGITFALFNDAGRGIVGPEKVYFDNIILTDTNVPEPASLTMLALGATGLVLRRRR